jgi:GNAT superfamily N-acetyltransferase
MSLIRPAEEADVPVILELIHELAVYEKEPDAVKTTEAQLRDALFSDTPSVFAHVAEDGGLVQGFALWFRNFSTWEGVHGIYLEDLYVRPEARGAGYGKALLQTLARHAVDNGYARVEWAVLNWNEPSIGFYRSLGALPQDEWSTFRLTGEALQEFGAARTAGARS